MQGMRSFQSLLLALLAAAVCPAQEYISRQDDCIMYYTYDGGSSVNHISGSPVTGARRHSITWADGRLWGANDKAARFNGSGSYIAWASPSGFFPRSHFTVAAWVKLDDPSQSGTIIERPNTDPSQLFPLRDGWSLQYHAGEGAFRFGHVGAAGSMIYIYGPNTADTAWHHVAARCYYMSSSNTARLRLYVDGELATFGGSTYWDVPIAGVVDNMLDGLVVGASDGPSGLNTHEINPGARFFDGRIDNICYYRASLSSSVIDTLHKGGWMPDPDPQGSGTFSIPAVLHKVLYDPPGDQSFCETMAETTYTTSMSNHWSFGAGATVTMGFEAGLSFIGIGASTNIEVSTSVDMSVSQQNEATWTVSGSETYGTRDDEDPTYMGPVDGDIIICQQATFGWRLWRKLKDSYSSPITDSDYDYRIAYWPLANHAADTLMALNVQGFIDRYSAFPEIVDSVVGQLAIDPDTRRVRPSLVAAGLLGDAQSESWGVSSQARARTATISRLCSYNFDVDMSMSASIEQKICGVSGSLDARMSAGFGTSAAQGTEYEHTCSYRLWDTEGWDRFTLTSYVDRRFGVYVFDVDSAQSYASFPFEDNHARRSLDWDVRVV
ncbi:MAG: hypothetical protein GF331_01095, partial [Chitinivibrionales bacterium]|nr:hypothetical protein [Chitinivibrionales bacterium]